MKQFEAGQHYYVQSHDYLQQSINPYPLYTFHRPGMQLLMQYLNEKYQTHMSQAIADHGITSTKEWLLPSEKATLFHDPMASTEKTYTYLEPTKNIPWATINVSTPKINYLHIEDASPRKLTFLLSKIPKNTSDHRQAFIVNTNGGHDTPVLLIYIRESKREAFLYLDAMDISSEWLKKIENNTGIKTYSNQANKLDRRCFHFVELLVMARDITGKRPGTDQYIIEHLLDKLERRVDPEANKVLLPNVLLKSTRDLNDLNQHIDLDNILEVVHKEESLLEFRKRYEHVVTLEGGTEKTVSSFLHEKSKKYAQIIAVQFYINELEGELEHPLPKALKQEFMQQAKKMTSLEELYQYAKVFLYSQLKIEPDQYLQLTHIKTLLQEIELTLNEEIPQHIKTEFTTRAMQLPPEIDLDVIDNDANSSDDCSNSSDEDTSVCSQGASPEVTIKPTLPLSKLQLLAMELFPALSTTHLRSEYYASVQRKLAYLPPIKQNKISIEEIGVKHEIDPVEWLDAIESLKMPLHLVENKSTDINPSDIERDILDFVDLHLDLGIALCEYFLNYYSDHFTAEFWSRLAIKQPVHTHKILNFKPLIQRFIERGELYAFVHPDLYHNSDVLVYSALKKYPLLFNQEETCALQYRAACWGIEQKEKAVWKKTFASRLKTSMHNALDLRAEEPKLHEPATRRVQESHEHNQEALSETQIQLLLEQIHHFDDLRELNSTLSSAHWDTVRKHISIETLGKLIRGFADLETATIKLFPDQFLMIEWLNGFTNEALKMLILEKNPRYNLLHHSIEKFDNFIQRFPQERQETFRESFTCKELAVMLAWEPLSSQAYFINHYISEEKLPGLVQALFVFFTEFDKAHPFFRCSSESSLSVWRGYRSQLSEFFIRLTIPKQIALINTPQIQSIIKEAITKNGPHFDIGFFTISLGISNRLVFDHVASLFNLPVFSSFINCDYLFKKYMDWCTEEEKLTFEKAFAPIVVPLPPEPIPLHHPEPEQQDPVQEVLPTRETGISAMRYSWFNSTISSEDHASSEQKKKDQGCCTL